MLKKNTCILFLCCTPLYAQAFNGVFLTGSGQISSGMGGVSLAEGVDRTSISDNPANLSFQDDGIDAQISLLNIRSKAKFLNQESSFESNQFIPIPSLSIVKKYNDHFSYGLSMTGAGASMDYSESAIHGFPADNAKVNLAIAFVSPTLSYKISPSWSIGASFNWGIQQFRAKGVLAGLDEQGTPVFLPSHGNQWAHGIGGSIGTSWQFKENWWLGASYISELHFSKLDKYEDDLLGASEGKINLPERYGFGFKHRPNEKITLAADVLRMNWQKADGLGKKGSFNWKNQLIYRAGVNYELTPKDQLRLGYSHASKVVDSNDTLVNFYANAISNEAWTVGYGHDFSQVAVNIAYEYAINKDLKGSGNSTGSNLSNQNHVITLGLSKSF